MTIKLVTDEGLYQSIFGADVASDAQAKFDEAMQELRERSPTARKILDELEQDKDFPIHVFAVGKLGLSAFYDAEANSSDLEGNLVTWEADARLRLKGGEQMPFMGLLHELGHALQYKRRPAWYRSNVRTYIETRAKQENNNPAQLAIENDNITNHEMPVALECSQAVRKDYNSR